MPEGYYGEIQIEDRTFIKKFWSSIKKTAIAQARYYRRHGKYARVVRGEVKTGRLGGGAMQEVWCVAVAPRNKKVHSNSPKWSGMGPRRRRRS
jgi:hypothetical protein